MHKSSLICNLYAVYTDIFIYLMYVKQPSSSLPLHSAPCHYCLILSANVFFFPVKLIVLVVSCRCTHTWHIIVILIVRVLQEIETLLSLDCFILKGFTGDGRIVLCLPSRYEAPSRGHKTKLQLHSINVVV